MAGRGEAGRRNKAEIVSTRSKSLDSNSLVPKSNNPISVSSGRKAFDETNKMSPASNKYLGKIGTETQQKEKRVTINRDSQNFQNVHPRQQKFHQNVVTKTHPEQKLVPTKSPHFQVSIRKTDETMTKEAYKYKKSNDKVRHSIKGEIQTHHKRETTTIRRKKNSMPMKTIKKSSNTLETTVRNKIHSVNKPVHKEYDNVEKREQIPQPFHKHEKAHCEKEPERNKSYFEERVKEPTDEVYVMQKNVQQFQETDQKDRKVEKKKLGKYCEFQKRRRSKKGSVKIRRLSISSTREISKSKVSIKLNCASCKNVIEKSEADSLLSTLISQAQAGKGFKCEICFARRSSKKKIHEHLLHHIHNKDIYCISCHTNIIQLCIEPMYDMKNHVNFIDAFVRVYKKRRSVSHSKRVQWLPFLPRCKKCGLIFDYCAALMQKVVELIPDRWATDSVAYKCHKCGVRSPFMKSIQEHVISHIYYREIVCKNCKKE